MRATERSPGLFFSELDPVQTSPHRNAETQTGWKPQHEGDRQWAKNAERAGRALPPATSLEIAFRHRGWLPDRKRVLSALRSANVGVARLERFCHCGNDAVCEVSPDGKRHRVRANYCGDRWCDPCIRARAVSLARRLSDRCRERRTLFVTLTIRRDDKNLIPRRRRLLKSFEKLRRHKDFRKRVTGGAACTQITRGKKGDHWHVHLHALVHADHLANGLLARMWQKATGDSFVVKVRAVGDADKDARYIARYASKGCEPDVVRDPEALVEAIVALRGARMLCTWGTWYGCESDAPREAPAEWRRVGRLDYIARCAAAGETWAVGVFRSLYAAIRFKHGRISFVDDGLEKRPADRGPPD